MHDHRLNVTHTITGLLCLTLLAAAPRTQVKAAGTSAGATSKEKASARPSKAAQLALRQARILRRGATGKKGEARKAVLGQVAAAYAKVMADFAAEPAVVASAAFAAAEIWRSQGDLARAKGLYRQAIAGDATRFRERCRLQLAHIARRQKDLPGAIKMYRAVAAGTTSRAHQARLWVGRCQMTLGQSDAAVATFGAAVTAAGSPRQGIEACNRLANLQVKLGHLDQATQTIARAARFSTADPGGKGKARERRQQGLTKAYARMSARKALQRAKDKRAKAHRDAQDLEKRRGK